MHFGASVEIDIGTFERESTPEGAEGARARRDGQSQSLGARQPLTPFCRRRFPIRSECK